MLLAVKMDPYCVLQSGKESVKTKRAHGMVLAWLHPGPTRTHAAAQRDLLENAANDFFVSCRWWQESELASDSEVGVAARRQ